MPEARDKYAEGPDVRLLASITEGVLEKDVEDARVAEARRLEPVREAQKRFKPYIAECRLLLEELRGIEREYRPTLDKLEKIRWQEVQRRRDVGVQRAAYYA